MKPLRSGLSVIAFCAILTACGDPMEARSDESLECVEIPNGQYFQWVDGRLVGANAVQDAREQPPETTRRIGATLAGMGYPWIVLDWDGQVAIVRGEAEDSLTRSDAFTAAKAVFEADPVSGPLVQRVDNEISVREPAGAIASRLTQALRDEGFEWLSVTMRGDAALLVGEARNAELKQAGLRRARTVVDRDPDAVSLVSVLVDVIMTTGDRMPVGSAVRDLSLDPTRIDCENAFFDTMAGRKIEFMDEQAVIEADSSRLLDAVSAVAQQCDDYTIEIGQHIGASSGEASVLDLSQRQASAIRDYLSAYGADRERLIARGYGVSEPLDASGTAQAEARNRRTEFKVLEPLEN